MSRLISTLFMSVLPLEKSCSIGSYNIIVHGYLRQRSAHIDLQLIPFQSNVRRAPDQTTMEGGGRVECERVVCVHTHTSHIGFPLSINMLSMFTFIHQPLGHLGGYICNPCSLSNAIKYSLPIYQTYILFGIYVMRVLLHCV
jgi:hypothetical protein